MSSIRRSLHGLCELKCEVRVLSRAVDTSQPTRAA